MSATPPMIGDWYSLRGGELFEVVAIDDGDGTIEVQYFDGTLEEIDVEDWTAQSGAGEIEQVEPPEDWSGSVDVQREDAEQSNNGISDDTRLNGAGQEGLDLFE